MPSTAATQSKSLISALLAMSVVLGADPAPSKSRGGGDPSSLRSRAVIFWLPLTLLNGQTAMWGSWAAAGPCEGYLGSSALRGPWTWKGKELVGCLGWGTLFRGPGCRLEGFSGV